MAENHPDEGLEILDDDSSGSLEELSGASLEDSANPSLIKGQERASPENNDALLGSSAKSRTPLTIEEQVIFYENEMNRILRWKEQLKVTSIEHQLPGAYYDMWIKEANLFFRRLVILRKRIETLKKQKRA